MAMLNYQWVMSLRDDFPIKNIPSGYLNIAMENGPFIDGLPIKNVDCPWLC